MSLARNSFANLLGGVIPAVVMLGTTPYLVWKLGAVDYGLLTLILSIVGYFALIDINLTAGSVKYVAQFHSSGDIARESQTITLGLVIYSIVGIIGAAGLFIFAAPLSSSIFNVPVDRQAEAERCLQIASLGFFFAQLQQYLNSLPQAILRYEISARFEAIFGTLVPLLSVVILWQEMGIYEILLLRVVSSSINTMVLVLICRRLFAEFHFSLPSRELTRTVLSFSGFVYLSKIAGLTYVNADRLIIGSFLGLEAVTLYSVPAAMINRLLSMTFRLSSVLFPTASALAEQGKWSQLQTLYFEGSRYMLFLNGSIVVTIILFSKEILQYWIGPDMAEQGWLILSLIGLAVLTDSLTNIPSLVNDSLGHSKVSGLFTIIRAALALGFSWVAVQSYGIKGVAASHLLAFLAYSFAFLVFVHGRTVPFALADYLLKSLLPSTAWLLVISLLGVALRPAGLLSLTETAEGGLLMSSAFMLTGWFAVLSPLRRAAWMKRLYFSKCAGKGCDK
jgi:O-antigen/teichoic acid export membrane protein